MKPWLIITSGVVLSIILLVWVYLFFAGDDAREGLFNALNFGDTSGEGFDFVDIFDGDEDQSNALLRQLSLRRVVGYLPIPATASTSASTYLVEAGTGHVYAIDIASGAENRISNITVATARQAVVSEDATYVVISQSNSADGLTVISLPHGSTTLDSYQIDADAFTFSLTSDNTLLYASYNGSAVIAYAYDLESRVETTLFTLPFREATILWGSTADSVHYAYPRTSAQLEGYLYTLKEGVLGRAPVAGYGLSAIGNSTYALFTARSGEGYRTYLYETESGAISDVGSSFLPEKCTFYGTGALCGLSIESYNEDSPDSWYSGEVSYSDELWYLDLTTNESFYVLGLESDSGRRLDVVSPQIMRDAAAAFFINKTDQSLWIYEGDFIFNSSDN